MPNKEIYWKRVNSGACATCGNATRPLATGRKICGLCKDKKAILDVVDHWTLRLQVIDAYGGHCVICGITNPQYLTIDHINNDGAAHRQKLFGSRSAGHRFYRWLRQQGYPEGYQVLCYNHNSSKEHHHNLCTEPYKFKNGDCGHK